MCVDLEIMLKYEMGEHELRKPNEKIIISCTKMKIWEFHQETN